jgi:hypothetical protein
MTDPRHYDTCNNWLADGDGTLADLWLEIRSILNAKDAEIAALKDRIAELEAQRREGGG